MESNNNLPRMRYAPSLPAAAFIKFPTSVQPTLSCQHPPYPPYYTDHSTLLALPHSEKNLAFFSGSVIKEGTEKHHNRPSSNHIIPCSLWKEMEVILQLQLEVSVLNADRKVLAGLKKSLICAAATRDEHHFFWEKKKTTPSGWSRILTNFVAYFYLLLFWKKSYLCSLQTYLNRRVLVHYNHLAHSQCSGEKSCCVSIPSKVFKSWGVSHQNWNPFCRWCLNISKPIT